MEVRRQVSIFDFDWPAFRVLVDDLERLLSDSPSDRGTLEFNAVSLVSQLYAQAVAAQQAGNAYADAGGDDFWLKRQREGDREPAYKAWLRGWLRHPLDGSLLGDHDQHFVPLDPAEAQAEPSSIANDLSEVLADLMVGAILFDQGRVEEAVWEWTFRFGHWGDHALRALKVLHWYVEWDWDWSGAGPCA